MQHLSAETLARLADGEAAAEEALHLERCSECRMELEEYREQLRALASLPELAPPAGGWSTLSRELAGERLTGARRVGWRDGWMVRAAAAVALFVGGAATGALALRERGPVEAPVAAGVTAAPAGVEARLRQAEEAYVAALTEYTAAVGADEAADPLNRLAALEGIVLTTRAALEEAPADPVINGYHLSALGQRDAILRQIDADEAQGPWF